MKILRIIAQVGLLYLFFLAGDYVQRQLHLPVPGSIVGLLILFILLLCKVIPVRWIESGATSILSYLPLFFIPATAGIVNHLEIFSGRGFKLIAVLMVSTALTIGAAAHSSQWLAGWSKESRKKRNSTKLIRPGGIRNLREKGEEI